MKRKFLALILAIVSVFTLFAISNKDAKEVEAYKVNNGAKFYFEKPSDWTAACTQLMIGHSSWSQGYAMSQVGTTGIYYVQMPVWDNCTKFYFANTDVVWGGEGNGIDGRVAWTLKHSSAYTFNGNLSAVEMFFTDNGSKLTYVSKAPNYSVKVNSSEGGTASISGQKISNGSLTSSTTEFGRNTTVTLTASAKAGFDFVGWYDGSTKVSSELTYTPKVTADKTYTAKFEFDTEPLKTLFTDYNVDNTYTRTTHIYADLNKIQADFENSNLVHSLGDLFHNVGVENKNVILDRTTTFVGDYLYFNNGVAFGSNGDKLTSFTWTEGYVPTTHGDAVDNHFITLKDFAELNATDKNGTVSLVNGWSVSGGVYTSTDDAVIKAAVAFTAPGWTMINDKYIDFQQVTVQVIDGNLVIRLWASSGNSGLLMDTAEKGTNNTLLFSEAIITK